MAAPSPLLIMLERILIPSFLAIAPVWSVEPSFITTYSKLLIPLSFLGKLAITCRITEASLYAGKTITAFTFYHERETIKIPVSITAIPTILIILTCSFKKITDPIVVIKKTMVAKIG